MSIRVTVGSLIESHCAKSSHPDRRHFIPQTRPLPSPAQCSRRCPQLRSTAPNSPTSVPNFPAPAPIFRTAAPTVKISAPVCRMAAPHFPTIAPDFFATAPNFPRVAPIFQASAPNFSADDPICNGLFPSYLGAIAAKIRKDKPSPVLSDTLSHRMGEGLYSQPSTFN